MSALSELEELEIPPLGRLEAFVTSGGLSTMPWTFEGELRVLENKTLRYPGHCGLLHDLGALGLFGREPVPVGKAEVVPRDLLIALLERSFSDPEVRDVCLIQVRARGKREGRPAEARVTLMDRYDPETGFRAMEKLTGWHAAIVLSLAARGEIPPGATRSSAPSRGNGSSPSPPEGGRSPAPSRRPDRCRPLLPRVSSGPSRGWSPPQPLHVGLMTPTNGFGHRSGG